MKKMFFLIGISGSGKGYYLKNKFLNDFKDVQTFLDEKALLLKDIIISPDDIRREVCGNVSDCSKDSYVWKLASNRLKETLDKYDYGVFDATGVSKKGRTQFLKNFKNIHKTAIVFEPNVNLSKERITKDIENNVDRSNVPMWVIDRQFESFKTSIVGLDWNNIWDVAAINIATNNLKKEFDDVFMV